MTMLFMDSFDHYVTADILKKYTSLMTGNQTIGAFGRNGTNGLNCVYNAGGVQKTIGTASATVIAGFAHTITANTAAAQDAAFFAFTDAGTVQVDLRWNGSTRQLFVTRNGTQIGSTGTTVLSLGVAYYIEFKVTINNSTGSFEVRINGVTEITGSSLDTQNTANATVDGIRLGRSNNIDNTQNPDYFDDLYFCNDSGANNNTFLGDLRIQCIFPDGAGGNTQWTPSAGSNFQNVDETAPNDDTDYNSDATIGDRDTYTYGNLSPSTATIKAIQIMTYARKDDAGTRTIAPVLRIGGVNYDQSNLPNLTTTYQYLPQVIEVSPATTAAFTLSEVNGMEAGAKVIA